MTNDYISQHYSYAQNPDTDMDFEFVKGYIFFGIAFTRLLQQCGIIDPEEHDFTKICQVFLKHAFQNQANAVCLQESTYKPISKTVDEYVPFATGFYPSIALNIVGKITIYFNSHITLLAPSTVTFISLQFH